MFFGGAEEVEVWSCVGEGEGVGVGVGGGCIGVWCCFGWWLV